MKYSAFNISNSDIKCADKTGFRRLGHKLYTYYNGCHVAINWTSFIS